MASFDPSRALAERVVWMAACAVAATRYGVPLIDLLDCRGRATRASHGRLNAHRAAIYLASTGANLPLHALARASGLSRSNLRHHLAHTEDARDGDGALDGLLDDLAGVLARAGALQMAFALAAA